MINQKTKLLCAGILLAGSSAQAENVEIYLKDILDNTQNGYCLDIAGGREAAADPADGLQGHTCYSPGGTLGLDQTFDTDKFGQGLLYMTEFDVCAEISDTAEGSTVGLSTCDGSDMQSFTFAGEGTISPTTAPEMCLTVGEDTRSGRSDANQIKVLSLEACSEGQSAYQMWDVRTAE